MNGFSLPAEGEKAVLFAPASELQFTYRGHLALGIALPGA
jgi:hypothetical protein